jgi:predicted phosphodiesterase
MKLGLITDIHEQTVYLERVLELAHQAGCEEIACLGDIVGHDPDLYASNTRRSASACVQLIRAHCRWVVAGNHDRENPTSDQDLSGEDLLYLNMLPDYMVIEPEGSAILLSHYLYPDFTGSSMAFVRRLNQLEGLHGYMLVNELNLAFAGHDHPAGVGFGYPSAPRWDSRIRRAFHYMPFHRYELDGQMMVCLLPALATRSGRAGFSIWDTKNRTLEVMHLPF